MKKPIIKIAVPVEKYATLESLAQSVIESMTINAVSFPTPSPPLAALQTAAATLRDAIALWGPGGNRGSKIDLVRLRKAARAMRNLLLKEAAYVTNLVDLSSSPEEQMHFIGLSGFTVKNERNPQGILEEVQNFHQFISRRLTAHQVKLKWQKPLNVAVNSNVKVYLVFRSATDLFSDAVFIGAATKTTFTDSKTIRGTLNSYFVVPFNNAGNGVPSKVVTVSVPA